VVEQIDMAIRIMTSLGALGAVVMGVVNSTKIKEIHVSINSRMDQLVRVIGAAEYAKGVKDGAGDKPKQEPE
jgi:hypothetical protein